MVRFNGFDRFVEELDEFADALDDIADEIDDAADRGTGKTAFAVERTAKKKAPVYEHPIEGSGGELRSDLTALRIGEGLWSVGSTKEYAPPTEYGSAPHTITPNGPYPLTFYWVEEEQWVSTYEVDHPGTPAQPFLRPALNRHRSDLVDNIHDEIMKVIDSEL